MASTVESPEIEIENIEDIDISELLGWKIVVFNDDVNSFQHVIDCFREILNHTYEQAEQCAHIIHYKGKCIVKEGMKQKLKPMCEALCDRELDARLIQ